MQLWGYYVDKVLIKEMYEKGYNATEIAKKIKVNKATINKHIQRNLKDSKEKHESKKRENKEIKKITEYEAKRYISDSQLVLKNRSIYKTNTKTGNIELKKDIDCAIPWDMPRVLRKEL